MARLPMLWLALCLLVAPACAQPDAPSNLGVSGSAVMAALYDNAASTEGFSVTNLTTGSFTIDAGAVGNRAAIVYLGGALVGATNFSVSVGGVSGTAIAGADITDNVSSYRALAFKVTAPPSGSQTATASWTGSASFATLGVITATGADQTTPLTNGTAAKNTGFGATVDLAITSTSGDLTTSAMSDTSAAATTNQTEKFTNGTVAGDVGPGTGSTTHSWSGGAWKAVVGANFKAVAAGGAGMPYQPQYQRAPILAQ